MLLMCHNYDQYNIIMIISIVITIHQLIAKFIVRYITLRAHTSNFRHKNKSLISHFFSTFELHPRITKAVTFRNWRGFTPFVPHDISEE